MRLNIHRRFHDSRTNLNFKRNAPLEENHDSSSTGNRLLGKTILFVDDEPSILAVRRHVFEALGYSVLTARSGTDALTLLRGHAVDALVLDYRMSAMNGEETARKVRRAHGHILIILSSGCESPPESVLEIVDASVEKGAGPQALVRTLEQLLQHPPEQPSRLRGAGQAGD